MKKHVTQTSRDILLVCFVFIGFIGLFRCGPVFLFPAQQPAQDPVGPSYIFQRGMLLFGIPHKMLGQGFIVFIPDEFPAFGHSGEDVIQTGNDHYTHNGSEQHTAQCRTANGPVPDSTCSM